MRLWILVAVVASLSVACSSEERAPVDEGSRPTESRGGAATPESDPPETDGNTTRENKPSELTVGDTAVTAAGNEITVYSYESVPPTDVWQPEPGSEFAVIDVEGCADPHSEAAAGLNPFDFGLQMPDNTRLQPDVGVKEPPLNDTTLPPGDCVRGYVTFQVPEGEPPKNVVYTASSIIKWAVRETESSAPQEQSPEEVLARQYEYINAGDYESAYALFDERSKRAVSPEQYRSFFEANAPYSLTDYSFSSVQEQGDAATLEVSLSISDATGQEEAQVTQQMVREGGGWRVVMRDDQIAAFTGADQAPQYDQEGSQYGDGARLAPDEQAVLGLGECQLAEAQADLGPEGFAALQDEFIAQVEATPSPEDVQSIQEFLAERGYTCEGTADDILLGR